ncbi:methyl-accepting chemotaxis protein [Paraburkholderia caballeronis]|nr:methyl-accepting chemotaxis protein [Paraburkholderia caballeronis]TDV14826.1 methyl-accepting chemotaxis protein [Paraburkholderia caballeronis]TDV23946.1 methyl-accepting chemotaxis protein [Paraburkholderia caballeronis]
MISMRRMTVRGQLIGGFGVLLVALVTLAAVSIYQVHNIRMRLDDIIDVNGVKERYAINFRGSVHDRSIAVRDVLLVDATELPAVVDHIQQLAADYDHSAQPLDQLFAANVGIAPAERTIYARINAARARTLPLIDDVIARQRGGDTEGARRVLLDGARPAFVEWLASINALIDFEQARSEQQGAEARRISADFRLFMGVLAALACALGLAVAWFVVRSIGRTLGADPRDVIALADSIREGDLSRSVALHAGDTSSVMATVARMRDTLADIVTQVRLAAEGVSMASREIAQGNADLGERTGRQASALEQATSALGEFDASVAANASNAMHADSLSKRASTTAGDGGAAVGRVTESMRGIRASSDRIGEIIAVINSIAFQTNILALNAAVEAARAGTHGRGFAVVASEVRKLAQHSAEAAGEVKALVGESVTRVNEGTREVDSAGDTIAEVVTSSGNVMSIMGEINDACRAQTRQIGEVRDMIDHLERATQQNVALVEQSGAAAASLQEQADALLSTVGLFKLADPAATRRREASAPARTANAWQAVPA